MMRNSLNARWRRWINRRIPRADSQTLSQKNIFILPTAAGVVYGLLLLVMLITGINYQNSLIYLLTFILGALFVGAMHQTHRNLSGLSVALVRPGEGRAGDDIPFVLRVTAGKDPGLGLSLSVEDSSVESVHVSPGESRDVVLPVPSAHRGYLRPDRIRIETRFPFGLLKAWSWLRPSSAGVAFPRPLPAPDAAGTVQDGSEAASSAPVAGQDNADLRPWREGDMSQRVMWKRFARTGQMIVADWQGEQGSPHWLDFQAFPGVDAELRLSYLAWMVADRVQKNARFGLSLPGDTIEPDSGSLHGERCLRALAVWGEQPPRDPDGQPFGTRQTENAKAGVSG
ncbi:DUF58 domain-containing protein [Marinobacter hydrocarbonoclasticus]|uniref:DUF58 domain-containing protein n=1 Tax=Marinobacter nauticus TaxID=2743 RepID=UPI001A8E91A6|nr:DUF58 domain-containing protein [Marinobacter nauticus]MBN8238127.1 DUF58 domain-containing protein [Marinobacter nauticus]